MTVRLPGYSRKLPRLLVLVLVDLVGHASWLVSSGQGGRGARNSAFLLSASADSYRRMPFSRTLGHTKGTSRSCSGGVRDTLYFCTSVVMVWWWCGGQKASCQADWVGNVSRQDFSLAAHMYVCSWEPSLQADHDLPLR